MSNPTGIGGAKPGEIRNPKGRAKKGHTLTDLIEKKLPKAEFVKVLINMAVKDKNQYAIKEILERIDGKVVEKQLIRKVTGSAILDDLNDAELEQLEAGLGEEIAILRSCKTDAEPSKSQK